MSLRRLLIAAVVAVSGCGSEPTAPGVPGDLIQRRAAWVALGIRSYDYEVSYSNEWIQPIRARITVRDGLVTAAFDAETNAPLQPEHWPTVDTLFVLAERWSADPENVVELLFHPTLSYPTLAKVDAPRWADDAQAYAASKLTAR